MNIKYFSGTLTLLFLLFLTPSMHSITFVQGITQVWNVIIQNKSKIPFYVHDEIFYPGGNVKDQKVVVNPGSLYRSKWINAAIGKNYNRTQSRDDLWVLSSEPALGRTITIWGDCGGSVKETNVIIIGNTDYATRVEVPSGTYTIITANEKSLCQLCIAVPFDNSRCQ